jgi:16S rRNA (guanine527-N7)-methyltransferase
MDERRELLDILEDARERGLVGPGPPVAHLEHSHAWAEAIRVVPESFLDLGSGGGVPGLPLLMEWAAARATLLDSRQKSAAWIEAAAQRLGWTSRVSVIEDRAEAAGRDPELRESFPLVVARGFGAPAVTAECGSAFVAVGGTLSVSEPPGGDETRWPASGLAPLGLRLAETRVVGEASFVLLEKVEALTDKWPRRVGKPSSRPLW